MIRPLSSEFSILLSDVKSQLAGRTKTSHGPHVGADKYVRLGHAAQANFNPRPPCGGRRARDTPRQHSLDFNPRPPCGGRLSIRCPVLLLIRFQSTAPVWGPTCTLFEALHSESISIHGPRVGADNLINHLAVAGTNFNPRPPCGGRRRTFVPFKHRWNFNPRPPCGGRLELVFPRFGLKNISIHGPRVGADSTLELCKTSIMNFNPRPPCGGRPHTYRSRATIYTFQSTAPVWGPTMGLGFLFTDKDDFNPRPPCGGRPFPK